MAEQELSRQIAAEPDTDIGGKDWQDMTTDQKRLRIGQALDEKVIVFHDHLEFRKKGQALPFWWPFCKRRPAGSTHGCPFRALLPADGLRVVAKVQRQINGKTWLVPFFPAGKQNVVK